MPDWTYISGNIKLHEGFNDNMLSCLYAAEKHGIVTGQPVEDRQSLANTAKKYLPAYTITDTVNTDCVIIKQAVVDLFGAPDITGTDIPAALSEYAEKIRRYGFSTLRAHKALYSYKSENVDRNGYYKNGDDEKNPLIKFLPLLDNDYHTKKRILFECSQIPAMHNGTVEVALALFEAFYRLYNQKYDIYLYTSREAARYHRLAGKYGNILYPDTISGTFHLGYAPIQMMWYEPQKQLNNCCLKIVQQIHDIIIIRLNSQTDKNIEKYIKLSTELCDGIVFISGCSKEDFLAYFSRGGLPGKSGTAGNNINNLTGGSRKYKIIYNAKSNIKPANDEHQLPFKEYFLIAGNLYRHKVIKETIDAISGTRFDYIAIGTEDTGLIYENVYGYKGGYLDEDFINFLYARCKALIFPSLYEGFGLPVIMGLMCGKHIIVYDSSINRELQSLYPEYAEKFHFFKSFDEISKIIDNADFNHQLSVTDSQLKIDSWDRAATELEQFFSEILNEEIQPGRLIRRWQLYEYIEARSGEELTKPLEKTIEEQRHLINKIKTEKERLQNRFGDYKLLQMLRFAITENLKHRHTKLFNWLKRL